MGRLAPRIVLRDAAVVVVPVSCRPVPLDLLSLGRLFGGFLRLHSGTAHDDVSGTAHDDVSGTAHDDVSGTAHDDVSGSGGRDDVGRVDVGSRRCGSSSGCREAGRCWRCQGVGGGCGGGRFGEISQGAQTLVFLKNLRKLNDRYFKMSHIIDVKRVNLIAWSKLCNWTVLPCDVHL